MSGPVPLTIAVWSLVCSSPADANVSKATVAPVRALNASAMWANQARWSAACAELKETSTCRSAPAPKTPHAESADTARVAATLASAALRPLQRADRDTRMLGQRVKLNLAAHPTGGAEQSHREEQ